MAKFDWEEYKEFKKFSSKDDKLQIAIDFVRSYYKISGTTEIYAMISEDDIGQMMLEKRDITDAEGLENFMFKS